MALGLARNDPRLSATAGVHPHVASSWNPETATWLRGALADPSIVAAGEMGLDYHYDNSPRDEQRAAFDAQLQLATQARKPAVIHAREADEDLAAILGNHPGVRAILHSWSSGPALLEAGIRLGHYFSFSGMVTFRSWTDEKSVRRVPRDRLLVETDAPYLAPVPHRGKRNEPAYVALVAGKLAELLGVSAEEIAQVTTENAERVFRLRTAGRQDGKTAGGG
jgi:TatD DNase family protein